MTIVVPEAIVSDVAAATSGTFHALWPLIALLISVPLAFYIARRILALFPKARTR